MLINTHSADDLP
jgi:hypothetical protein